MNEQTKPLLPALILRQVYTGSSGVIVRRRISSFWERVVELSKRVDVRKCFQVGACFEGALIDTSTIRSYLVFRWYQG